MSSRIQALLLVVLAVFIQIFAVAGITDGRDNAALKSFKDELKNYPPNWEGNDPCGGKWEGITCSDSRVIYIALANTDLAGSLSGDIFSLDELKILDLSYNKGLTGPLPRAIGQLTNLENLILVGCSFSGTIPDTIGDLKKLVYLSLNSNKLTGKIPASIGLLSKLYWLDLADNELEGEIPVSTLTSPGLDMLHHVKHFHFGQNKLSGVIPEKLFSSEMILIHVLFDDNQLTGPIPNSLGLVQNLEVVRLDRNRLTGPIPSTLGNLTSMVELYFSNNKLTGSLPDLSSMESLVTLDVSNNTFTASLFPSWVTSLKSLSTLRMVNNNLEGPVPTTLFSLPRLQSVELKDNRLNDTLDIGASFSNQLELIDLQNNLIDNFRGGATNNIQVILAGNLVCQESGETKSYCSTLQVLPKYSTPQENCLPVPCSDGKISSPRCSCAYPYTGILYFRAASFSALRNLTYYSNLEKSIMVSFGRQSLPVDSVSISNPRENPVDHKLEINLMIFPFAQDSFNRSGISRTAFALSNQTYKPPPGFGPFYFIGDKYEYFTDGQGMSKSHTNIIIGAVAGGLVLVLLLVCAGVYAYCQRRRADHATEQNNPFAKWDTTQTTLAAPQLKAARSFTFEEIKKSTNNFSDANVIGAGGYGKVYRGDLSSGQMVAIKRAQQGSLQGGLEFKTEIELLSRVHHKNVVRLFGFCFDRAEQMLIYEYIPNGSLKDSLTGMSGIRLDWTRRLKIALGAARGLAYLHELADPPIIHRDIKSNNILLDDNLNGKVADFGLSKLVGDPEQTHVTTQVKGTLGYLDPEYYMTQQLTEKSDVYGFGVVMLELLTGKSPIERGKYVVREVKMKMDKTKNLYALQEIVDSTVIASTNVKGFERFVDVALRCVEESGIDRPTMGEVVKEIENIMQYAGMNPNSESASSSKTYEEASKGSTNPYGTETESFDYSGNYLPEKPEAK